MVSYTNFEDVVAIAQDDGDNYVIGCGYKATNALVFKVETDKGDTKWAYDYGDGTNNHACKGVVHSTDADSGEDIIVVLIQSNAGSGFGGDDTGYEDAYILELDRSGDVLKGVQISLANVNMNIQDGSLINWGTSFFWAGYADGFDTDLQTRASDTDQDGIVFKYVFDHAKTMNCIWEDKVSAGKIRNTYSEAVSSSGVSKVGSLDMQFTEQAYLVYQSPYSGGFELKDSFKIPRPCAKSSLNMTANDATYYYGQRTFTFDMAKEPGVTSALAKLSNPYFLHQNGSEVQDWLAELDIEENIIKIQTDDQNFVSTHRVWIEGCTKTNDLIMVNLYIDVQDNSAPSFVGGL